MWYLLPIAGLVVGGIAALCSNEEKRARKNWAEKHKSAEKTVQRLREDIEKTLQKNQERYDFYLLNDFYYSSFRCADHAYSLLEDSKTSLSSIRKMLVAANKKRRVLSHEISNCRVKTEKKEKIGELRNLTQFRDAIQEDFDKVLAQKRELAGEVSRLNNQTRELKLTMASKCGAKGKVWYESLQQRIHTRNQS